jgi:hypothetical protein
MPVFSRYIFTLARNKFTQRTFETFSALFWNTLILLSLSYGVVVVISDRQWQKLFFSDPRPSRRREDRGAATGLVISAGTRVTRAVEEA